MLPVHATAVHWEVLASLGRGRCSHCTSFCRAAAPAPHTIQPCQVFQTKMGEEVSAAPSERVPACAAPQVGGRQIWFNGTDVTHGTVPAGSRWRMMPIPRGVSRPSDPVHSHVDMRH